MYWTGTSSAIMPAEKQPSTMYRYGVARRTSSVASISGNAAIFVFWLRSEVTCRRRTNRSRTGLFIFLWEPTWF